MLPRVTRGYNQQSHSKLMGAAPAEVRGNGDIQFSLDQQVLKGLQANNELIQKRSKELLETGAFRVAAKRDKFKRGFQPNYSKEVREVESAQLGYVTDTKGETTLAKRTLPVPRGSAEAGIPRLAQAGSVQTENRQKAQLEPFRERLLDFVRGSSEALLEKVAIRMRALDVPKIPGRTTRQVLELMGFRVAPRYPDNPGRAFVVRPPAA